MTPAGLPSFRVHVVEVGQVRVRPDNVAGTWRPMLLWTLTSRRWTAWLPVNVVVLEHPRGTVLFDTGQDPASLRDPSYYPTGVLGWIYRRQAQFRLGARVGLAEALSSVGVEPTDVATVVLSHLHQDHAGNVRTVSHAPVLADPHELGLLDARTPETHGVLVRHLSSADLTLTPVAYAPLDDATLAPFTQGSDLHGDGSLVLLPTPGHSVGSMSLLVRRAGAPPLLLVGDVTYDPAVMATGRVPGTGATRVQQETTSRINALRDRLPGLVVVAAHDPAAADAVECSSRGDG